MNAEDLYTREDLMTPEELEDFHHDPSDDQIPTMTPAMREFVLSFGASPEGEYRREFERRPPAMGATPQLLDEIASHCTRLPPVQLRSLKSLLRDQMLRQLISCDGAATVEDLVNILREEMESGVPALVPEWYEYSNVRMGPRKIGYDGCSNRGCLRTETLDEQFSRCSKCKVAIYCSRNCQKSDWKVRHKQVCKEAAKQREMIERTSHSMSMFMR